MEELIWDSSAELITMTKKGERQVIAIEDFSEIGIIMMTNKRELSKRNMILRESFHRVRSIFHDESGRVAI